jgi:hypothetical protein
MRRRGSSIADPGCAIQLGIFAVLLIVGLLLIQQLGVLPATFVGSLQTAAPPPTPTTIVLPPVLDVISDQPRLETATYFLSTVAEAKQQIGLLQQEQSVLLVACGKVTAGIDLTELTEDDIVVNGTQVFLRLPAPKVFESFLVEDADPPCTYVAHRSDGILLAASQHLESEARRQAVQSFEASALQNNILQEAQTNAEKEIQRLLLLVGYTDVQFTLEIAP